MVTHNGTRLIYTHPPWRPRAHGCHLERHLDWWVRSGGGAPAGDPRTGVSLSPATLHMRTRDKAATMAKRGIHGGMLSLGAHSRPESHYVRFFSACPAAGKLMGKLARALRNGPEGEHSLVRLMSQDILQPAKNAPKKKKSSALEGGCKERHLERHLEPKAKKKKKKSSALEGESVRATQAEHTGPSHHKRVRAHHTNPTLSTHTWFPAPCRSVDGGAPYQRADDVHVTVKRPRELSPPGAERIIACLG